MKHKKHKFSVFWSEEDQDYVGICETQRYRSLSHLDSTPEATIKGIIDLVEFIEGDLEGIG